MAEEQVYEACIEVRPDGTCVAQLCDLPACYARAADAQQTLAALTSSIPAYFAWLSSHDEYTPIMHGPFAAVAAETVHTPSATTGAFFESDASPLLADDFEWYTAVLDWSYQDVEASLSDASSLPLPLSQLCERQVWLLTRFEASPTGAALQLPTLSPAERVAYIHAAALKRVQVATSDDRSRIIEHDDERWSLRKVLRRSILLAREAARNVGN